MIAKKGNRILQIETAEKESLKADGYDIVEYDEQSKAYKVVENATGGKKYSVAEYSQLSEKLATANEQLIQLEKLKEENAVLKKENAALKKTAKEQPGKEEKAEDVNKKSSEK